MAVYLNPIDNPDAWERVRFGKLFTPGKCKVEGFARKNEYDKKKGKGTSGATITLKGQPPAEGTFTFWAWTPEHFQAWGPIVALLTYKPTKGTSQTTKPNTGSSSASQGASSTTGDTKDTGTGGTASASIPEPGNTSGVEKDKTDTSSDDTKAISKDDAIAVYYPALADIGVFAICPPEDLGQWEPDGDDGQGYYKRTIKAIEFKQAGNENIAATPTGPSDGNAPGTTPAGGSEGAAPGNGAAQQQGAASDAQGAWGAP